MGHTVRSASLIEAWRQDARAAGRLLLRDARFTGTVVAVLALGLGVSHLFFTLTYAHTVRGLPMRGVDRVLHVSTLDIQNRERGLSYQDFADLRRSQRSFDDLAAFVTQPVSLGEADRAPERVDATYTTSAAFTLAQVAPVAGRLLTADDDVAGSPPVVVLAERLWRTRYAADPALLGREVEVNGAPATVVGIIGDESGFPSAATAFLSLSQLHGVLTAGRESRTLRVFGRLRPGVTEISGRADLDTVAAGLALSFPDTNRDIRLRVVPLNDRFRAQRQGWMPFMIAGVIVVAVAGVNVANLLMVRATRRTRELAIRRSLGASPWRLVRQLLLEAAMMSAIGGALGLGLSRAMVRLHERNIPEPNHPYWAHYHLDGVVLAALGVLMAIVMAVSALVPALLAGRVAPAAVLRNGDRASSGRQLGPAFTTTLLAVQLALALVLAAQVGLSTVEARFNSIPTDAVVDTPSVLTAAIALPADRYPTPLARRQFHDRLVEALRAVPGVTDVALASHLPLGGASERPLRLADATADGSTSTVAAVDITADYFAALGITPLRGRTRLAPTGEGGGAEVIINERLAAVHFAGRDPIGQRVSFNPPAVTAPTWHTVVGIVPDVRQSPAPDPAPVAYVLLSESTPANAVLLVRHPAPGGDAAGPLRDAVRSLDPHLPLQQVQTLAAARWNIQWVGRMSERLALTVTLSTMLLAMAGLYAVLSHRMVQRTREIGVRMALGAGPRQIAALAGASVRTALAAGLALGLLGVLAWTRAFSPMHVWEATVLLKLGAAAAVSLAAIAGLACAVPARRAMAVQPADTLRADG